MKWRAIIKRCQSCHELLPSKCNSIRRSTALARPLGRDVVRLRYTLGEDWTGDPSIFFNIVLTDPASRPDQLRSATNQVTQAIEEALEPDAQWGVHPYYSFRSASRGPALQEEAWI